jgi:hypothetical protein
MPSSTPREINENRLPTLVHPLPPYVHAADAAANMLTAPQSASRQHEGQDEKPSVGERSRQLVTSIR